MEVSGEVTRVEVANARGAVLARLFGWKRFLRSIHLAVVILGGGVMFAAIVRLGHSPWAFLPPLLYGAFALVVRRSFRSWGRKAESEVLMARGYSDSSRTSVLVTADGLHISDEHCREVVAWPGVSEIAPANAQWLLILANTAVVIPRRFFTDMAVERAFIGAALGHMGEAARARSVEAITFAAGGHLKDIQAGF